LTKPDVRKSILHKVMIQGWFSHIVQTAGNVCPATEHHAFGCQSAVLHEPLIKTPEEKDEKETGQSAADAVSGGTVSPDGDGSE
jgi:hypothetical protein